MYYDKESNDFNHRMAKNMVEKAKEDVDLSIKFTRPVKFLKIFLPILIISAYFYKPQYLTELLVFGISFSLLLPQSFVDTYLEKLIDLQAAETDERQILNATEANKHFSSAFERIDKLENKIRKLQK